MKLFLYRVYQICVMAPVLLAATVLTAVTTIIGVSVGVGQWSGYYPMHYWARLFCVFSLVKVEVAGRENIDGKTSYVFVANHQGAYDIFSIAGYLNHNFRWMMKAQLRRIPLVGYACERAHQIYVDKSSPSKLRHTMQRAESLLSRGMSLVVFPEGARTPDGHMRAFKKGAFMLAAEFQLPVVPITIDGSFGVLPRTSIVPHWGTITLTIHQPIMPHPVDGHDLASLMENSARAIETLLPQSQHRRPS